MLVFTELAEAVAKAREKYGGRVNVRTLDNGDVVISPWAKRTRKEREDDEEALASIENPDDPDKPPLGALLDVPNPKRRKEVSHNIKQCIL